MTRGRTAPGAFARAGLLPALHLARLVPRRRLAAIVLLSAALAASEGVGLLLLVPLLALAGVGGGGGSIPEPWAAALRVVPHSLPPLLAAYVAVVAVRALVEVAAGTVEARIEADVTAALRERLYRTLVAARWDAVVRLRGSALAHGLTVELERVSFAVSQLLRALLAAGLVAVYGAAALSLAPPLALLGAAGVVVLGAIARLQQRGARADGEWISRASDALFTGAAAELAALRLARASGTAHAVAERFARAARQYADALVAAQRRWQTASAVLAVSAAGLLATIVLVAVSLLRLPAAPLLVLLYVSARLLPRAIAVYESLLLATRALPAVEQLDELQRTLDEAAEPPSAGGGDIALHRALRLQHVSYRYPEVSRDAVIDVTFTVPAGALTAVIGPTGAGKSTLLDLILGLLTPGSGVVLADDTPLDAAHRGAWLARTAYVPQDVYLSHASIAENVRAGGTAGEEEVLRALRLAGASALLDRLPRGVETVVGDRGILLSGGERQRIALARALLRDPMLLVLDEPSSALDEESESALADTLRTLLPTTTVLVVTHRLTLARRADQVVVLREGRVVARGTPAKILTADLVRLAELPGAALS